MNAQTRDAQAILARIEVLERQNQRLKITAASGSLFLLVVLLSAFQVGKPASPDPLDAAISAYSSAAKECTGDYEQTCLAKAVLALPNTQAKLNFLAYTVDVLWYVQEKSNKVEIDGLNEELARLTKIYDKNFGSVQAQLDQIGALAADDDSRIRAMGNGLTGANPQLDEFKDAVCPVLRTARINEVTRTKLDSACGLH